MSVKKGRRPQKQHKFRERTTSCRFLLIYPKHCWPRRGQRFCFLRRAPLTVSIYAYRGALLVPAAFQTASERVKTEFFDTLGPCLPKRRQGLCLCSQGKAENRRRFLGTPPIFPNGNRFYFARNFSRSWLIFSWGSRIVSTETSWFRAAMK